MAVLKNAMDLLIQFTPGAKKIWNGVQVIVPDGVWVLDTTTNKVYRGNGMDLIGDLQVYWDLAGIESAHNTLKQLPTVIANDASAILVVNSTSDGFEISSVTVDDLITDDQLIVLLGSLSDTDHDHDDRYYTKEEIDEIVRVRSGFTKDTSNVVSALVLEQMMVDDKIYSNIPYGVADEFITDQGIASGTTGTYDEDSNSVVLDPGESLVTEVSVAEADVDFTKLTARHKEEAILRMEVSRNNGSDYRLVDDTKLPFEVDGYVNRGGECDFGKVGSTEAISMSSIVPEDIKGSFTSFTVDTDNTSGHADIALDPKFIGCKLSIVSGDIIILDIEGDGTANDSVKFVGSLTTGVHTVSSATVTEFDGTNFRRVSSPYNKIESVRSGLPAAREYPAAINSGGIVYICGGKGSVIYDDLYSYDIANKKFKRLSNMPKGLYGHAIALYDGNLYVHGGISVDDECSNKLYKYNIESDTWVLYNTNDDTQRSMHTFAYCALNNKIYLHGGRIDQTYKVDTWEYDPVANTWTSKADGNVARSQTSGCIIGDKLYVGGGYNGTALKDMYEYDITNNLWAAKTDMAYTRYDMRMCNVGDQIYVVGGSKTNELDVGEVFQYDTVGNSWSEHAVSDTFDTPNKYAAVVSGLNIYVMFGNTNGISNDVYKFETDLNRYGYYITQSYNVDPEYLSYPSSMYVFGGYCDGVKTNDVWVYDVVTENWVQKTSGATARYGHTAVTINDKMYIFGGIGATYLNDLWEYNPSNDTWTQLTSGATARYGHSAVAIGDKMYVFGGNSGVSNLNDLWEYNPSNDTWTQLTSGTALQQHTAVAIGTKMYIYGGYDTTHSNKLYEYDTTNDTWTQLTSGATARRYHTAVAINDKMYVFGGWDGADDLNDLWEYNPSNDTWTQLTSGATTRRYHTAVATNDKMYIFGGNDGTNDLNDLWEYNPSGDSWTQLTSGATAKSHHTAVVVKTDIQSDDKQYVTYDISNDTYALLLQGPRPLKEMMLCHVGDDIYVHGGIDDVYISNELWRYNTTTRTWTQLASNPVLRYGGCMEVSDGTIYVYGGRDKYGVVNDIWKYDIVTNAWTRLIDSTIRAYGAGSAIVGDIIYIAGGWANDTYLDSLQAFNIKTERWVSKSDMVVGIAFAGLYRIKDYLYILGGKIDTGISSDVYRYNILDDVWTYTEGLNDLQIPLYSYQGEVINDVVYLYGGLTLDDEVNNRVIIYDPENPAWTPNMGTPVERIVSSSVSIGDNIYMFGGHNNEIFFGDLWKYNTVNDVWTQLPEGPPARRSHTAVAIDDKMYIFGGENAAVIFDDLWEYDTTTNIWTQLTSGAPARRSHAATVVGSKMYIHGGYNGVDNFDDFWEHDLDTDIWTELTTGPIARRLHDATSIDDKVYIICGLGSSILSDIWEYNTVTGSWIQKMNLPEAIYGHVVESYNGRIYISGGRLGLSEEATDIIRHTYEYNPSSNILTQLQDNIVGNLYHSSAVVGDTLYTFFGKMLEYNDNVFKYDIGNDQWDIVHGSPGERNTRNTIYGDKIYCFGGFESGDIISDNLFSYDLITKKWEVLTKGPSKRIFNSLISYNSKLYVYGGYDGTNYLNDLWEYNITNDTWTQKTSGATARYGHTAVAINDKMYIFGGYDGTNYLNDLWEYNLTDDTWTQLTSGVTIRRYHSAAIMGDKMYIFGGTNGTSDFNDLWEYDTVGDSWTQLTSGSVARRGCGMIIISDKIYIYGGYGTALYLNDTWIYDITLDQWSQLSDGLGKRSNITVIEYYGNIYIFGGSIDTSTYTDEIVVYYPSTDSWAKVTDAPPARYGHSSVTIDGKIYIYGGYDDTDYYNDLWKYNPSGDSWTQLSSGSTVRRNHTAVVISDKMYIFGGWNGTTYYNDLWEYDPVGDTWTQKTSGATARHHHTAVTIGNKMYIHGGREAVDKLDDLWEYDPVGDSWIQLTSGNMKRYGHTAVAYDGKMYIYAGINDFDESDNDLLEYDPIGDSWRQLTSCDVSNRYHVATVINSKMYIFGGWNSTGTINDLWEYDFTIDKWTQLSSGITAVSSSDIVTINNKLYIFGGSDGILSYNDIWSYDPLFDSYTHRNVKMSHGSAISINNQVYVLGGQENNMSIPDITKYQPIAMSTELPVFGVDITGDYLDYVFGQGTYQDYINLVVRQGTNYLIYSDSMWKIVIRDNSGWEYLNASSVWTSASSLYEALNAIADIPEYHLSINDMKSWTSHDVPIDDLIGFIDNRSFAKLTSLTAYTHTVSVAPVGNDIKARITNLSDKRTAIHGITTQWK